MDQKQHPPDQQKTWSDFGLDDRIKKAIAKHKWTSPTPVQAAAIPYALQGKDILANAKTGSGKTAAYVLPIIQRIITEKEIPGTRPCVRGLVLVPTTELAEQVHSVITSLCHYCVHLVRCLRITADEGIYQQIPRLAEIPDIIVATPGRILLHLTKQSISLRLVQMVVIDEADLIMSFGYVEDLEKIKGYLPSTCQGFLMSATLSQEVTSLKNLVLFAPVILELEEVVVEEKLKQFIIRCTRPEKFLLLYVLLKLKLVTGKTIIFVNTMDRCFQVKLFLDRFLIPSVLLNADLPQNSRYHILQQFNRGAIEILIATDEKKKTEKDKITKEVQLKKKSENKPQKSTTEKKTSKKKQTEEKSTEPEEEDPSTDGPEEEEEDPAPDSPEEEEEEEDPETPGGGLSASLGDLDNLDDLDDLDNLDDDSLGDLEDDAGEGPARDSLGDTEPPSPDLGNRNTESLGDDDEDSLEEDDSDEKEVNDKKSDKQQEKVQNQKTDEQNEENPNKEFGVARGIDFRNVANVINFDFPLSVDGYVHRVGRTARAGRIGAALSLIADTDMEMFDLVSNHQATLGCSIQTFTYKTAVLEGFRYRVEDVLRSISKREIKEARGEQIKNEMLNSQKLKSHFEENPADLYALKHDKELQKKKIKPHLKHIPFYLMPSPEDLKKRLTPTDANKHGNDDRIVYNIKQLRRKRKSNPLKSFSYKRKGGHNTDTRGGKRRKKTKRRDKIPTTQFKPRPYPIT